MKNREKNSKKKDTTPLYDSFPTSMKIKKDPQTNVSIPTDQAVEDVKKWADYNAK